MTRRENFERWMYNLGRSHKALEKVRSVTTGSLMYKMDFIQGCWVGYNKALDESGDETPQDKEI